MNDLLKQEYYFSLTERDRILPRLQILQVFYFAILAAIVYMLKNIDYSVGIFYLCLFFHLLILTFGLVVFSIWLFIKALTGHEYKNISNSKDILDYEKQLKQYEKEVNSYNEVNSEKMELPDTKTKLDDFINETMSECIDENKKLNSKRMVLFRSSLAYLLYSIVSLFVSGAVYIFFELDATSPRKINISLSENSPLVKTLEKINTKEATVLENKTVEIEKALQKSNDLKTTVPLEKIQKNVENQKSISKTIQIPKEPEKPKIELSLEDAK